MIYQSARHVNCSLFPVLLARYIPKKANDEEALRQDIIALATKYGRYGYRRITALLKADGL